MELPIIILAYAVAGIVAVLVTALFSKSIDRVLAGLIAGEIASAWSLFIKFALFVATFTAGMPAGDQGKYIGWSVPVVIPPVQGDGTMFVMKSVGGALLGASWFLLIFFGVTLTAGAGARLIMALRLKKEKEAREAEEEKIAQRALPDAPKKEPVAKEEPVVASKP